MENPSTSLHWIPLIKLEYQTTSLWFLNLPDLRLQPEVLHQKYNTFSHSGISSKHQIKKDWENKYFISHSPLCLSSCYHFRYWDRLILTWAKPVSENNMACKRTDFRLESENTLLHSVMKIQPLCSPAKIKQYFLLTSITWGYTSTIEMRNKTKLCNLF